MIEHQDSERSTSSVKSSVSPLPPSQTTQFSQEESIQSTEPFVEKEEPEKPFSS